MDGAFGRHGGGLPDLVADACQFEHPRGQCPSHSIWNQISIGLPAASRSAISSRLSAKFFLTPPWPPRPGRDAAARPPACATPGRAIHAPPPPSFSTFPIL